MMDFISNHPFLVGWTSFVLLVYLYAYLDYVFYHYNISYKASQIYDALTEEE